MTISKTTIVLALACALLIVALCWKMCGHQPEVVISNYKDSALQVLKLEKDRTEAALKLHADSLFLIKEARRIDSAKLQALGAKLLKTDVYTRQLYAKYMTAIDDTGSVGAPLFWCDSLANQAIINSALAIGYKETAEQQAAKYESELSVRDSINAVHTQQSQLHLNIITGLTKEYDKLLPRTKFYAGVKAFGGQETVLAGFGASGVLVTKKEKVYTAGVGMLHTGRTYFEAGAHFLITFRKR